MNHSTRQFLKFIVAFFITVSLAIAGGYLFRTNLLIFSLERIFASLAKETGIHATFSEARWDGRTGIRLNGVKLKNYPPQSPGIAGSIAEIQLQYSLTSLQKGLQSFVQGATINVISPSLDLTWQEDKKVSPDHNGTPFIMPPNLPSALPKIWVYGGLVSVHHPEANISADNIQFSFTPSCLLKDPFAVCLDIDKTDVQVTTGSFIEEKLALSGRVIYSNGVLQVPSLSMTENIRFTDTAISTEKESVKFRGSLAAFDDEIIFSGSHTNNSIALSFNSAALSIKNIAELLPAFPPINTGKITAKGNLAIPLDHIEQTTGAIDLQLINGSYGDATINRFSIQARADNGILTCPALFMETPGNNISIENLQVEIEDLAAKKWDSLLAKAQASLTAKLSDQQEIGSFLPEKIKAGLSAIDISKATLKAKFHHNTLNIEALKLDSKLGAASLTGLNLSLTQVLSDWQHWPIAVGNLSLMVPEIAALESFMPTLAKVKGKATFNASGKGTFLASEGKIIGQGENLEIAGIAFAKMAVEVLTKKDSLNISIDSSSETGDQINLQGILHLAEKKIDNLKAQVTINELGNYSGLFPTPLPITGYLQANIAAKGKLERPTGRIELEGRDLLVNNYPLNTLHAVVSNHKNNLFKVEELAASSDDHEVLLSAALTPANDWHSAEVDIEKFLYNWQGKEIQLNQPGRLFVSANKIKLRDKFTFKSDDASLTFFGGKDNELYDLQAEAEIFSGEWLSGLVFRQGTYFKTARLSALLKGPLDAPSIHLQGDITGLGTDLTAMEFTGTLDTAYENEKITINQVTFAGEPNARATISGTIPFSFKEMKTISSANDLALKSNISIPDATIISRLLPSIFAEIDSIHGSLDINGSLLHPSGHIDLKVTDFTMAPALAVWAPPGKLQLSCQAVAAARDLELEKCVLNSNIGEMLVGGKIEGETNLAEIFPLNPAHPVGKMAIKGEISLREISWLATRVEELRRLSGEARGTFTLSGPPARPEISGKLSFEKGEMRFSPTIPALREVSFQAEIAQNKTTIKDLRGMLGGAPFSGYGWYEHGRGPADDFEMKMEGSNLLFYREDGFLVRGDAKLQMKGNHKQPLIEGDISLTDCKYTKPVDFLSIFTSGLQNIDRPQGQMLAFHDEPLKDATLRITATAQTPCSITNNLIRGQFRPELSLSGTGETLALRGTVYLNGMKISMPAGRINFDSGTIVFRPESPDRPELNLSGKSKMMGYDINIQITGTLDDPIVTLSSSPLLQNEELLLLLLVGTKPTRQNGSGQAGKRNMTNVAVYIGRGVLEKWFPLSDSKESGVLDRLQLDIGRSVTQTGDDTLEAQFLLKEKMFTDQDELYLIGERDVWDDFNGGLRFVFRFE